MTEPTNPQAAFTVTAQIIHVTVSDQPDVENRFGPGRVRPDSVRISYRGHHMDARVDGRWVRETGEVTTERLDQDYAVRDATDIVEWPDWLCALATLLRPAAALVPASAPTDPRQPAYEAVFAYIQEQPRDFVPTTVVDRNAMIWRAVHAALDAMGVTGSASAPADRAVILREAAAKLHEQGKPVCVEEDGDCCWFDAVRELRRMVDAAPVADETQAHPPRTEFVVERALDDGGWVVESITPTEERHKAQARLDSLTKWAPECTYRIVSRAITSSVEYVQPAAPAEEPTP
jgi:hypothetical protein